MKTINDVCLNLIRLESEKYIPGHSPYEYILKLKKRLLLIDFRDVSNLIDIANQLIQESSSFEQSDKRPARKYIVPIRLILMLEQSLTKILENYAGNEYTHICIDNVE